MIDRIEKKNERYCTGSGDKSIDRDALYACFSDLVSVIHLYLVRPSTMLVLRASWGSAKGLECAVDIIAALNT